MDFQVQREEEDLRHGVFQGSYSDRMHQKETIDNKYLLAIRAKLRMLEH
jgi:hypothetical protein